MFKVEGKDFSGYLTSKVIKLVRTYKGEIKRTQAGLIASFPVSFITVGFDLSFMGLVDDITELEQLFLSADVLSMEIDYNGVDLKGNFSATSNATELLKDKGGRHMTLKLSVVSDGSTITKPSGTGFAVTVDNASTLTDKGFATVQTLSADAYLNGAKLPSKQILILGDTALTSTQE